MKKIQLSAILIQLYLILATSTQSDASFITSLCCPGRVSECSKQGGLVLMMSIRDPRQDKPDEFDALLETNTSTETSTSTSTSTSSRRDFLCDKLAAASLLITTATAATTISPDVANAAQEPSSMGFTLLSEVPSITRITQSANQKRIGGLSSKIRSIGFVMDELQRDLMQERWDLVETYPPQLRSFVPLFTTYTDSAFPSELPTDKGLRVALRYEVGRFFASLERLRQATARRALSEAYVAYADMSLHYDRYMRVGGIYTYYDDSISNEPYFKGITDDALVYSDPTKDPAEVRDLIIMVKGPDKGKTGILIGIYPDGSNNCVVKLDRIKGMRQILVVPRVWVGKRLGEQLPDEVFLIPKKTVNDFKSFI